jgi:lipooligosaccharide transport system permease protein
MFTAAYECTFGTFIRLEFEKVYDGMLAAPITVNDLIVGEIIWAGTKGVFFTFAVLCVLTAFRIVRLPEGLLTPLVGFITGVMFATLSLWITSFVKTIQHFNFYFTGFISPMFFFSGVVFPISNLPPSVRFIAEILPLTHCVRLARAVCIGEYRVSLLASLAYAILFTAIMGWLAIRRLRRRLIR